jgi:hypothetical protein
MMTNRSPVAVTPASDVLKHTFSYDARTALLTALPAIKNGTYEDAQRANKPMEDGQRRARDVGLKR